MPVTSSAEFRARELFPMQKFQAQQQIQSQSDDLARKQQAREAMGAEVQTEPTQAEAGAMRMNAEKFLNANNIPINERTLGKVMQDSYNNWKSKKVAQYQQTQLDPMGAVKQGLAPEADGMDSKEIGHLRTMHSKYLSYMNQLLNNGAQESNPELLQTRANVKSIENRLVELGMPITGQVQEVDPSIAQKKGETIENARADVIKLLDTAKDETGARGIPDGVIDDVDLIERGLDKIAYDYNINTNDPDWKRMMGLLESKKKAVSSVVEAGQKQQKIAFEQKMKKQSSAQGKGSIDAERARLAYLDINATPNDVAKRTEGLNALLRGESGAAIGKNEVLGRIQNVVPGDIAKEILSDQSSWKAWIADKAISDDQFTNMLINDYVDRIDHVKLVEQLKVRAGEKASDIVKGRGEKPRSKSVKFTGWK
jgi:hypothetical protein